MNEPQPIELDLDAPAYGGSAIARHQGRAIFVPYGVPGETVRAHIVSDKGRYAFADIADILAPAPARVPPPCPYFGAGRCGGCHYQHIDYTAQLAYKQQIVAEQFARVGKLTDAPVQPTLAAPDPWHYRTHATFRVTATGKLGYVMTDDRTLLPVESCHLLHPALGALFDVLRNHDFTGTEQVRLQVGSDDDERLVAIKPRPGRYVDLDLPGDASVALLLSNDRVRIVRGSPAVHYYLMGKSFQVTAGSFFQVNLAQAKRLVALTLDFIQPQPDECVLDLYSGVGLFTAFMAEHAVSVTAVESFAPAVRDARRNLRHLDNVTYVQSPVEQGLTGLVGEYDAVVIDPPRSGMKPAAIDALIERVPRKIAYVSCDPTTLARDVRQLVAAGYRLMNVQPVDMFPQTYHIETVAMLERAGA